MSNRTVHVISVNIPAMATVGTCVGIDTETKEVVRFGADHRPARHLGEAIISAKEVGDDPPVAALEDWQVLSVQQPDPEITPEGL